ncbi:MULTISPECIES: hypothetical protein [unclassified Pseudomonas]|uniref:hypothetical protein n=1 Tax=unclassified Pseudomonas TaxID=196821 RepID=UPI0013051E23|nr:MULTISPECIES: hypothetical protein [unclassified Pseudomonas]
MPAQGIDRLARQSIFKSLRQRSLATPAASDDCAQYGPDPWAPISYDCAFPIDD